jgi:hypothetical protein
MWQISGAGQYSRQLNMFTYGRGIVASMALPGCWDVDVVTGRIEHVENLKHQHHRFCDGPGTPPS